MGSLGALREHLALRLAVPEAGLPSVKRRYRSAYGYLGYDDLAGASHLANLTLFEVALRLIDFSPVRDYLAQSYYVASAKGQVPFDPVCLRRELGCGWRSLAKLLAGEHGAGWRRLLGFREGDTPSASGLRYFFCTIGPQVLEEMCCLITDTLRQASLLPEHSTFPGDPPQRGVSTRRAISLSVTTSCCTRRVRTCAAAR